MCIVLFVHNSRVGLVLCLYNVPNLKDLYTEHTSHLQLRFLPCTYYESITGVKKPTKLSSLTMSPYQGAHPRRQNRKFIASLSPTAQVKKVIADQNNLKGSYDLRTWSASARKEPTPSIYFILRVQVSEEEARSLNQNVNVTSTTNQQRTRDQDQIHPDARSQTSPHRHLICLPYHLRQQPHRQPSRPLQAHLGPCCSSSQPPSSTRSATRPSSHAYPTSNHALTLRLAARAMGLHRYVQHFERQLPPQVL